MANTVIGRVVATEKSPTTIDNFTFWTDPELIGRLSRPARKVSYKSTCDGF